MHAATRGSRLCREAGGSQFAVPAGQEPPRVWTSPESLTRLETTLVSSKLSRPQTGSDAPGEEAWSRWVWASATPHDDKGTYKTSEPQRARTEPPFRW